MKYLSSLCLLGLVATSPLLGWAAPPSTVTSSARGVSHASPSAATSPRGSATAFQGGNHKPDANEAREVIPAWARWQPQVLFATDAAFEAALKQAASERKVLAGYRGRLHDPHVLAACLDQYFKTRLLTNRLTLYAHLRADTALHEARLQGANDRALAAMSAFVADTAFVRSEVLALEGTAWERLVRREPRLQAYRPYLDEMCRRRKAVLDPSGERVLAAAGDNQWAEIDLNELPSDFEKGFKALLGDVVLPSIVDEQGQRVQLTTSNYGKYRSSGDRRVRRDTVEGFFGALKAYRHAFAALYSGQVRFSLFLARSRGYKTALEAYLDRDHIDPAVYHNLLRSVHANLKPLHRYMAMRRKLMGVSELHLYDLYPPLVKTAERDIPYSEACAIVPKALAPLGPDYLKVLHQALDPRHGWIDVYPHKDKDSGAYCASIHGVHPFLMLNYFNQADDVSTLAHELGHAMHSYLSSTTQPYVTSSYVPFIAEIASTCNEKLLSDYLARTARTDAERLYVLNETVDRLRTTIYRQTLFAEFELTVHTAAERGTPITADFLDQTYARLIREYYGPAYTMGPQDDIEWAYIPHLYYKFYVFSYATGLSSGVALAERIQKQGQPAVQAYLGMLRGGCSKPPLELLKGAGVDLTRPTAIEAAARLMDRTLDDMEVLLKKQARTTPGGRVATQGFP